MKKNANAALALLLALCLVMSLCACGKDAGSGEGQDIEGSEAAPEFTYAAKYTQLPSGSLNPELLTESGFYLSYQEKVGENIPEGKTPEYEGQYDVMEPRIAFQDFSGSTTALENYSPVAAEIDGEGKRGFQSSSGINKILLNEEGNLVVLENLYCSWYDAPEEIKDSDPEYLNYFCADSSYYVRVLDQTGAELSRGKLDAEDTDSLYSYNCQLDDKGNLVVAKEGGVCAFDMNGQAVYDISFNGYIYSLAKLRDGRVCAFAYNMDSTSYADAFLAYVIDSSAGRFESKSYALSSDAYELISGGGEYDLYYTSGTRFYGYRLEDETEELLFDWLACDVNSSILQLVGVSDDGVIRAFSGAVGGDGEDYAMDLIEVSKVPYDSVPQKESLRMAVLYMDYTTQAAVIDFNRSHDKYRIDVVDYSEYNTPDDYSAGLTKLTTEIMAGNMPDILSVSEMLPYRQLAAKGLLEDLYPYIESDSGLNKDDFFSNVLTAMEVDGKLYAACAGFMVQTVVGASSVVGDTPGWTYEDYYAALASMPEGCEGFDVGIDRDTMLTIATALDMTDYVDWSTGQCRFDSEDFIKVLEFAKQFPDASYYENYDYTADDSPASRIAQGKQMLVVASFSGTDFFFYDFDKMFGGSSTCIGFPTNNGVGNVLTMGESYAMSSSCQNKEAAWEFLRGFLTEDYQINGYSLPTNKNAFEKQLAKAMEVEYMQDANGNYLLDENGDRIPQSRGMVSDGLTTTEIYATTPRQAEQLREAITSATKMIDYDTSILDIVTEEAAAYFAGQKSAEEVAKLIQSKANLYINEQK